MSQIRVVIADAHVVVLHGLRSYLLPVEDLTIVGTATRYDDLLAEMIPWRPDVVLLGPVLSSPAEIIEMIQQLLQRSPRARIVLFVDRLDPALIVCGLRAGAVGYVLKGSEMRMVVEAIRRAAQGKTLLDAPIATHILGVLGDRASPYHALTEREREVLLHLAYGRSNQQIADLLVVSIETVRSHVTHILGKLGLSERSQVMIHALKHGLVSLNDLDV